jgi:hypothetical protein
MCEVSFKQDARMPSQRHTEQQVISSLVESGILEERHIRASHHVTHLFSKYGYPIPTSDRDVLLSEIIPSLEKLNVYSRGRFGAWKYEYGNMDHSFMQGVEAAEYILTSTPETMVHS